MSAAVVIASSEPNALPATCIWKPDLDHRDYRLVRMGNGLTTLLVSDPSAEKASASIDVNVGFYSDPDELPGLAHFLEHLLFMGTEKYPVENEYSEYLARNGGCSNAYTCSEHTNYHFEVNYAHLHGALDRFAQFFIAPLFSESCVDRELCAVDSENKKNLQSDPWRFDQLMRSLCNPKHPFHKFGTGSRETLEPKAGGDLMETRRALIQFHKDHYSVNIMRLVVFGRESLDQLLEWSTALFANVPNKNVPVPSASIRTHPYDGGFTQGQYVRARSIRDKRTLELYWRFPTSPNDWREKPGHLISHLVGHEGEGSILSLLRKKSWAMNLSAGHNELGLYFGSFELSIELTEIGLKHFEEVVLLVFQYVQNMKNQDCGSIPKSIYEETRKISELRFRFQELSHVITYVSCLASTLQYDYDPKNILSGSSLLFSYDADKIKNAIEHLNTDFILVLSHDKIDQLEYQEKWYGTEYSVQALPESLMKQLENVRVNPELVLPKPNPFLPENLQVEKHPNRQEYPTVYESNANFKLWVMPDSEFWVPKSYLMIHFKRDISADSPRMTALSALLAKFIADAISHILYDAILAGLETRVKQHMGGLRFESYGFSDRLYTIAEKPIEVLCDIERIVKEGDSFERIKNDLASEYRNFSKNPPCSIASFNHSRCSLEHLHDISECLQGLATCGPDDLIEYARVIRSGMFVEVMMLGNKAPAECAAWLKKLVARVQLGTSVLSQKRAVKFPKCSTAGVPARYEMSGPNPAEINSALFYGTQVGTADDIHAQCMLRLFEAVTNEKAFHVLRTVHQLGYITQTYALRDLQALNFALLIQSEHPPSELEKYVESFLRDDCAQLIEGLSTEEFDHRRKIVVETLVERPKSLREQGRRFTGAIEVNNNDSSNTMFEFALRTEMANVLRNATKGDLVKFYAERIAPSAVDRRCLVVHLVAASVVARGAANSKAPAATTFHDIDAWKKTQELYPIHQRNAE